VDIKYKIIKSTSTGNPGEFFGLQSVMKLGDDTSFGSGGGGGGSPEDWGDSVAIEDPNANQIMQNSGVGQNNWDEDTSSKPAASGDDWG